MQFGRYLLLASSRPGTQPATLQGIWNDRVDPPWGSKYTANINLQMNYWLPDPANLSECIDPLIRLAEEVSVTGAEIAAAHYGARGWVLHHNTDIWRAAGPVDGAKWGLWPTGGAWLCAQLWDHAVFLGRPEDLVKRLYPLIAGAVRFIIDILMPLPGSDWLVTNPSLSPENVHPHGASLCAGPAMDRQIIRDLFDAYIAAAGQLGIDDDLVGEVGRARPRLPDRVGPAGQLQEWLEDWDLGAPEIHHRHVSHLYGLYPSQQIDLDRPPSLRQRPDARWKSAATMRQAGASAGGSTSGRDSATATMRTCAEVAAVAGADLSEPVRLPPAVPDRRQLRGCRRHSRNARAVGRGVGTPAARTAVRLAEGSVRGICARGGLQARPDVADGGPRTTTRTRCPRRS